MSVRKVTAGEPIDFSAREGNAAGETASLVSRLRLGQDDLRDNLPCPSSPVGGKRGHL
jgi:hypothetical protein